jgi:hypothetical protein
VFDRSAVLYVFNPTSDNTCTSLGTSWREAIPITDSQTVLAIDVGNTSNPITDSTGQVWQPDVAYSTTNSVAGYHASYTGTTGSDTTAPSDNITNVTSDSIYQTFRTGTDVRYQIPVSNGDYIVEFHLSELDETVNASGNRRLMDFKLENTTVGSSVSPYESMNNTANKAFTVRYSSSVSDGTLDIEVDRASSSNNDARLMGLVIYPRRAS